MKTNSNADRTGQRGGIHVYVFGYALSIMLTLIAFSLVSGNARIIGANRASLIAALIFLALVQLAVQLVFFLHMDKEARPEWKLLSFLFAGFLVFAVVVGSLWIMNNLDYNMMPPDMMDAYMLDQ